MGRVDWGGKVWGGVWGGEGGLGGKCGVGLAVRLARRRDTHVNSNAAVTNAVVTAVWLSGENRDKVGRFVCLSFAEKGGFVSLSQLVRNCALLFTKPIIKG